MAYSFQTFSLNQVLTSAQMNQVEVNIRDHKHNAAGVIAIQESDFEASCVDQAALKTTTASGTTTSALINNGQADAWSVTLTGANYSWVTWSAQVIADFVNFGNGDVAAGVWGFSWSNNSGSQQDADVYRNERYVQASPPYNFGPLFVFLMLDNNTGEIKNIEVAEDPPWAYHGPTNILPTRRDFASGRTFVNAKTWDGKTWEEVKQDPLLMEAVLLGNILPVVSEVELTLDYKDSDKDIIPHHWIYNKPSYFTGRTVLMLEPGTALMQRLDGILQNAHASEVHDLIKDGYLAVDNSPILLPKQPKAVQVVRAAFTNNRRPA